MTWLGPPGRAVARAAGGDRREDAATADPDVDLMLRAQRGDDGAFPELFRRIAPRLLKYVRRLVGSEARAEEIAQDVFVQMFRSRHRYRPESRLSTWVYTIATNLCLNELRRPERRLRLEAGDNRRQRDEATGEPELLDPAALDPERAASGRELLRALEAAVGALPPKQRAAVLLSRIEGMAYRDVALALGVSEGAVKALLFRAMRALRDRLRDFL